MRFTRLQVLVYLSSIALLIGMAFLLWTTIEPVTRGVAVLNIHAIISIFEKSLILVSLTVLLLALLFMARHYVGHRQTGLFNILFIEIGKIFRLVQVTVSLLATSSFARVFVGILEGQPLRSYMNHVVLVIVFASSAYILQFLRREYSKHV